jgi:hypothetical protein
MRFVLPKKSETQLPRGKQKTPAIAVRFFARQTTGDRSHVCAFVTQAQANCRNELASAEQVT